MTYKILKDLMEKHNIPEDVTLMSDSGWECDATDMDCIYYCAETNCIVFAQGPSIRDYYHPSSDDVYHTADREHNWELLYGEYPSWDIKDHPDKLKKIKESNDVKDFKIGDLVYAADWCFGTILMIEDGYADVEFDTCTGGGTACFKLSELKHAFITKESNNDQT